MIKHISIHTGDPIAQDVDVIVNSANNWLVLGTGVAGEIRTQGGPRIQEECDRLIEKNGNQPFAIGSAVWTSSGYLASVGGYRRQIIHAIGMGYTTRNDVGDPHERILATAETVAAAVRSSLQLAEGAGTTSIAFPLMCAREGYSIYPGAAAPYISLATMLAALQHFTPTSTHLSSVSIIVPDSALTTYGNCLLGEQRAVMKSNIREDTNRS